MQVMRFAAYGPPEVLAPAEIPDPIPGPDDVLVAIEAASVVPGDTKLRAGAIQWYFPISLPCVPGRDGAGVVAAVGERVDYARVGDAVSFVADRAVQGSYAGYIVRDRASIVPLPARLSFAEGAAFMHASSCAWIALVRTANVQPGQRLLVQGAAGAIGSMAVQLGHHLGAHVTGTCRARNADYVRGLGADDVIAYDQDDYVARGRSFDVALDLIGGDVHAHSCAVLRPGGMLAWLHAAPFTDVSAAHDVRAVNAPIHDDAETLHAVFDLGARGILKPQVSRVMPLAQAAEAHRLIEAGQNSRGRIVLDVRGNACVRPGEGPGSSRT